jgi:Fic family protein
MAKSIPNPDLFVGMYVRREAILSSQIENIACSLEEVLEYEGGTASGSHNKDVAQVVNYVRAVNEGLRRLEREKLSAALLRDLHAILVAGDEAANPGSFRTRQNWVGPRGSDAGTADFVPPPEMQMLQSLGNLEYFVSEYQNPMPALVRCALAHAQFETIHPFTEGNGRIGRLLIALMLCQSKRLERPLLYLSLYLLGNRSEYYARLMDVRSKGDWLGWVKFLLLGVEITAKDAVAVSEKLAALNAEMEERVKGEPGGAGLLKLLYRYPIIDARGVRKHLTMAPGTAIARLRNFEKLGIVRETTGQKRGRVYRFDRYISILDAGWSERKGATVPPSPPSASVGGSSSTP